MVHWPVNKVGDRAVILSGKTVIEFPCFFITGYSNSSPGTSTSTWDSSCSERARPVCIFNRAARRHPTANQRHWHPGISLLQTATS